MSALSNGENMLSEEKIRGYIANESLQNIKIFTYDMTDSTNTRAREHYASEHPSGPCVFIANGQTAGRGRRGRSFDSSRGAGIYMSILTDGGEFDMSMLTVHAAAKFSRAIDSVCGLSVGIKWVNDIFVSGKKLAGILAEGEYDCEGRQKYAVTGIGINLTQREFPPEIKDIATSVEAECGRVPDINRLAAALIDEFFRAADSAQLLREYRARSVVIGKRICARRISGGELECEVLGITDSGALLVKCRDGGETELISAEVSIFKNDEQ